VLTGVGAVVGAVGLAVLAAGPVAGDGLLLDLLVAARSALPPGEEPPERSPVAVIALDEGSLYRSELSAYPRVFLAPVWASVIDGVLGAGGRAIGFDVLFSYSANAFAPDHDRPFLEALGRHRERIVLARSAASLPAPPFLAALRFDEEALGVAEIAADPDGGYRRIRRSHETEADGPQASLASALLRRAAASPMPDAVVLAPHHHLERIPTYALADVHRCASQGPDALARAFAGRIVLVGTTLPDEDRKRSSARFLPPPRGETPPLHPCGLRRLAASAPSTSTVPGVFLHAEAVAAVVQGRVTAPAGAPWRAGLAALAALAGSAAGLALAPWLAAVAVALAAVALFGVATVALTRAVWVPLALPLGVLAGAPLLAYVVRYLVEERQRRRLQHAFGHYVSPRIVERLAQDAAALRLGGELREATVMFADLSGFTALSGKLDAEALTALTNRYLALIADAVEETGGYVDKFIGDAVMAIWGAPAPDADHAASAVRAARAAAASIDRERAAAEARGEAGFSVKIGLNSGPVVVGNVGTPRRYNYTAIGETVNVASRLEAVPALYACPVVAGPRTAELAAGRVLFRELDAIRVKGREASLAVFEPLVEHARATPADEARAGGYAEALTLYRARRFEEAAARWEALAALEAPAAGGNTPPARMAELARRHAAEPPPPGWDGTRSVEGK
jgi:adenylate cyclase